MTDQELQELSQEIVTELIGKKRVKLEARFYKTRSLNHKIKLERGRIYLQLAETIREAPHKIIRTLIIILILKLYKYRVDRRLYGIYRSYLKENAHLLPAVRSKQPSSKYTALGRYFNLDVLFDEVKAQFFTKDLVKPKLGWSLRKSYRRLGFYSADKNLLVISRIFDSKRVPEEVVRYLLFHEMLHMVIPVVTVNGRRRVHPPEFRKREKSFPHYEKIQKWLKANLQKL